MTSTTTPKTHTIQAGLMWAKGDDGLAFDLHSGKDSMSSPGEARITEGKDGTPVRIVWEADNDRTGT